MGVFSLRFLSKGRHYCYGGGKMRSTTAIVDGVPVDIVSQWDAPAQFGPPNMPPPTEPELQFALKSLRFRGLGTTDPDSLEHVVPVHKVGVFDTQVAQDLYGWSDEQREQIEQSLLSSSDLGDEYVVFAEAKAARPWPRYDDLKARGQRTPKMVADKVKEFTVELGLNPDEVAAYERQNLNRDYVLDALADISTVTVEEDEPVEVVA